MGCQVETIYDLGAIEMVTHEEIISRSTQFKLALTRVVRLLSVEKHSLTHKDVFKQKHTDLLVLIQKLHWTIPVFLGSI